MEKLEKLYEGKAKQLYATDDPEVLWVEYKNSATAGDGEKKEDFAGKGRLNNLITTLIFDLLKKRGITSAPAWASKRASSSRNRCWSTS